MSSSTSPVRRRIPTRLFVVVLGAAACVPLVCQLRRPTPPQSLGELAERIKQKHPQWRIEIMADKSPRGLEAGFLVATSAVSRERIVSLAGKVRRENGPQWSGVVLCKRAVGSPGTAWGEYGAAVGDFEVFGDPDMWPQIAKLLTGEGLLER